nr:reverse transcriptase domain-containing protein [Tanacetum cinerariifolium]
MQLRMIKGTTSKGQGNLLDTTVGDREVETEKVARSFEQPPRMMGSRRARDMSILCYFHEDHGHDTNDYRQLKRQIEELVRSGQLSHLVKGVKKERTKISDNQREEKKAKSTTLDKVPILMIDREEARKRNNISKGPTFEGREITFPLVTKGSNSSAPPSIQASKLDSHVSLVGFSRKKSWAIGEVLLEITIGNAPLTRSYHQIQMAEEDEDKTTFFAGEGVYCYQKMPFGLKNVRATYQRLVDKVFSEQVGRNIEAYIDDMVIKSTSEEENCKDLANAHCADTWRSSNNVSHRKEVERKTDTKLEETKLSYEWKLYTDEASSSDGSRAGLMLIDPEETKEEKSWKTPIHEYLLNGLRPQDPKESRKIIIKAPQYKLIKGSLYKKSFYIPWLRCIAPPQTNEVIKEIHKGSCSFNAKPRSMVVSITKQRYYWSSMHRDISRVIQDCENCKEQSAVKKRAEIKEIAARNAWPFSH